MTALLPACGGSTARPALPPPLARLAGRADALAVERSCPRGARRAEALQRAAIAAINGRRVPGRLQEELLGRVNEVAARAATCPPGAPDAARDLADWLRTTSENPG